MLVAAFVLLGGAGVGLARHASAEDAPTPTPTPVVTGNMPVVAISPALCFMLTGARYGFAAVSCLSMESPDSLATIADLWGDGDGRIEASDFAGLDLDGNQVHQMDDYSTSFSASGSLFILAFVPNHVPVEFRTNRGVFVPYLSPAPPGIAHPNTDAVGQVWRCDTHKGQTNEAEDADCDNTSTQGDGVVVARLRARYGDNIADIGPGTVTVRQSATDQATIKFTVVGEPWTLSFTTLESTIQDGITDMTAQCPLPGDAAGFLGANGTPERSIVLAIAKDIEGNAVTGAIINWDTDDHDKAQMAAPLTPTLDLGSFGFGAPNIICGTKKTGTVEVKADISRRIDSGGQHIPDFDPGAALAKATKEFSVVGVPAAITLTAAPSELACDGVASSTISATVLDAQGSPVAAGQAVRFDVQVLGSANPVGAKTDGKGVATSVVTPLSGDVAGVPVVVTSGDVQASVLVKCIAAGAGPTAPTTAPGAPEAAPGGTVPPVSEASPSARLPKSGEATARRISAMPVWTYLLAAAALALAGCSAASTIRAKRR